MLHRPTRLVIVLFGSLLAVPLFAAGQATSSPGSTPPSAQPPVVNGSSEAEEYEKLRGTRTTLINSLRQAGGIRPEHHGAIALVLEEAEAFSERWPANTAALAMQIQMRTWLNGEDPKLVDLYRRMMELRPDDGAVAAAWLDHRMKLKNATPEEVALAYEELAGRFPDNVSFILGQAENLIKGERYEDALAVLQHEKFNIYEHVAVFQSIAKCRFYLKQFEETLTVLKEIEESKVSPDPQARPIQRPYRAYIFWSVNLAQEGRYDDAVEALEAASFDPEEAPHGVYGLADLLFATQRFDEALSLIQTLPENPFAGKPWLGQISADFNAKRAFYDEYPALWAKEQAIRAAEAEADDLPRVQIMTSKGRIVIELFENEAPNTVANFISLAESDFYNQIKFHHCIPDFMIQSGDPNTKPGGEGIPGHGGPGYTIADEHTQEDHRSHFADSISMAKSLAPDTAGSQFMFMHRPAPWLNPLRTVFGRVIEGRDVVLALRQDDEITSMTVLRKRDHEYVPVTLALPETPTTTAPEGGTKKLPPIPTATKPKVNDPGEK